MAIGAASASRIDASAVLPELGMRRVRWVRITVSDAGVQAHVAGVAHRLPIVRPVPLRWANRLIQAGCPYVVRREQASGPTGPDA